MAVAVEKRLVVGEKKAPTSQRTPMGDAWRQFKKNRVAIASALFLIVLVLATIFADNSVLIAIPNALGAKLPQQQLLAPRPFDKTSFKVVSTDPNAEFPLGADYLGRDILSRTLYGARVSLAVAFVAAMVSLLVGLIYGMISGFSNKHIDNLMMRFVDYLYAFPVLMIVILLQVYFKALSLNGGSGLAAPLFDLNNSMGGLLFLFIAIGLLNWLQMARIARGQVLAIKNQDFVTAAHSVGASNRRIISKHLLPNILGPCIVAETLQIPSYIFLEAFLSFLGLGVLPPTPSWGIMISETYSGLRAHPALLLGPCVALVLTTLAFNFLGDGLRDAFDPRMRGA